MSNFCDNYNILMNNYNFNCNVLLFFIIFYITLAILNYKYLNIKTVIFLNAWMNNNSLAYKEFMNAIIYTKLSKNSKLIVLAKSNYTVYLLKEYGIKEVKLLSNFDEFNMINIVREYCNRSYTIKNEYILYIHFKGSYHDNVGNRELRKMIIHYIIYNYRKCIEKLKFGSDVCSSRYSLFPYRHTSGNMWWSKCSYINTLKHPKYTSNGIRYSGMQGYSGDRYSAEKWVMSNSKAIPSDLLSDNIDFSYNTGNELLYKIWIQQPSSIPFSPNSNILCSTVNYNDHYTSFTQSYYTLFFNLLYDYEVYFNYNSSELFDLGWCKSLITTDITNKCNNESQKVVKNIKDYCKLSSNLHIMKVENRYDIINLTNKTLLYILYKCKNEKKTSNISICIEKKKYSNIIKIYNMIYYACKNISENVKIIFATTYESGYNIHVNCKNDFCGKWYIYPFRGNTIEWQASCKYIIQSKEPKYYIYSGIKLSNTDSYYGINYYSYLHWPNIDPFRYMNCSYFISNSNVNEVLFSVLLNAMYDLKSNILNTSNIHKCLKWCKCINKINVKEFKSLNLFCSKCYK